MADKWAQFAEPADKWKQYSEPAPPPPEPPASFGGVARGMATNAMDAGIGAIKGIGRDVANVGGMALNPFGANPIANAIEKKTGIGQKIHDITEPKNLAQTIGGYLPDVALMLAPGGAATQAGKILPNAERAGLNFEKVFKAVGSNPVNIDRAAPAALRAEELKQSRFNTPPIMTRVLQRLSPGAEPVGLREASDLATNAGKLSATERMSIKGPMQAQVNSLAKALRESNQAAADAAGVGKIYTGAVNEYRRAMKLQGMKEGAKDLATSTAAKWLAGAAGLGAGSIAARKVFGE